MKKYLTLMMVVSLCLPVFALADMSEADLPGVPLGVVKPIEGPIKNITLKPKFGTGENKSSTAGIPGVPAAANENAKVEQGDATSVVRMASKSPSKTDPQVFESSKVALNVILGENMILPIAAGHPNRLLTPFDAPKITTFSDAQISVDHSVVYVTPNSNDVVTMFVTEKDGDQEAAVSLTLVPKAIPPREVRLLVSGSKGEAAPGQPIGVGYVPGYSQIKASEWEKGQEYTEGLKQTLRQLAMGQTPTGYGLRTPIASDPIVSCHIPGLKIEPGQVLDGHNVIAVVARATNETRVPLEINAGACYQRGVLAAAAWPSMLLAPTQSTELYVLFKRPDPGVSSNSRPSLLRGGKK